MVVHVYNPSYLGDKEWRIMVWGQLGKVNLRDPISTKTKKIRVTYILLYFIYIYIYIYIYMEVSQWNTCIPILHKNVFFKKSENREVKQFLSGDWYL
jgi:hypothetical protein